MRFTPRLAKFSIALTAAVFLLIAALWIRSAGHREAIIFQAKDSNWSLSQSEGVICFHIPHDPVRGYVEQGVHYVDEDLSWMKSPETFWWGSFSFDSNFSGSHPFVEFTIPHWFLLCLSTLFLLPAGIHCA